MLRTPKIQKELADIKARQGSFSILASSDKKKFFFTTDHCQRVSEHRTVDIPEHYVSISFHLPLSIVRRESCPTGLVRTLAKYIEIFHNDEEQIDNPDHQYQFEVNEELRNRIY